MNYKALVTDPYNHNDKHFITYDYPSKKEFIREIRANGYKVSDKNVEAGKVSVYDLEDKYFQKLMSLYDKHIRRAEAITVI